MKIKTYIILLLSSIGMTACEKNIDIDFHSTVPLYTVEGWLSQYETMVRVSKTKNMNDTTSTANISNAQVTISDEEGNTYNIPHEKEDFYHTHDIIGEPGKTYRLDVVVDGQHFTSTSTMNSIPVISSFRLIKKKLLGEDYIFGDIRIKDIPNETDYYYVHLYRNDIPYRTAVLKDDMNPGKELQQLLAFNREGSNDYDTLREGDILECHVRTIDEKSYDYLYSILQIDNTGTNPPNNFEGGCLGYFSAFGIVAETITYHTANIEEE